eukprot:12907783-Prorocentrum_lima.AAC.1
MPMGMTSSMPKFTTRPRLSWRVVGPPTMRFLVTATWSDSGAVLAVCRGIAARKVSGGARSVPSNVGHAHPVVA